MNVVRRSGSFARTVWRNTACKTWSGGSFADDNESESDICEFVTDEGSRSMEPVKSLKLPFIEKTGFGDFTPNTTLDDRLTSICRIGVADEPSVVISAAAEKIRARIVQARGDIVMYQGEKRAFKLPVARELIHHIFLRF